MEEMNNNLDNNIDETVTDTEVTEEVEETVEETVEDTEEVSAEYESTEGEDNFSEEVMEVALTADENGMPVEQQLSGLTDKQKKRKMIIDKITTGILIFLLASPVLILLYIFLWFILR